MNSRIRIFLIFFLFLSEEVNEQQAQQQRLLYWVVYLQQPFDGENVQVNLPHFNEGLCLVHGVQYAWSISDLAQDGTCSNVGPGSYELKFNGVVIASRAEFGASAEHTFYTTSEK